MNHTLTSGVARCVVPVAGDGAQQKIKRRAPAVRNSGVGRAGESRGRAPTLCTPPISAVSEAKSAVVDLCCRKRHN
ncbi:hypothetical protein NDU88_006153 [Pleurodeles waltl]|uniref:Uncharacterized protein n=1 Tax=Pleurodeles waltl TaxID=8319 RepID=A0AAV7MD33_PLEWA|nr:hypothetical protein NDU88_006153 [Pleurodeles waltl]